MTEAKTKNQVEIELREAVLDNYLIRRAGRHGVPQSNILGYKLIDQTAHWNNIVYSYETFLVKDRDLRQLSPANFTQGGNIQKKDAEKIFFHLVENEIIHLKNDKYFYNLNFKNIRFLQLQSLLTELDKKSIFSKLSSRFSDSDKQKISDSRTVNFIQKVLDNSIIKKEKTVVKITLLGEARLSKSFVFRIIETAGNYEVVKVDPKPTTWIKYVLDLTNQRKVATELSKDINILVPGVTYALAGVKYLDTPKYKRLISYQGNLSPKQQDKLFGDLLLKKADKDENLKKFLQIGDRYGYFMPYMEEGLLSDYLNNIHGYVEIPGSNNILRINHDIDREISMDFSMLKQHDFSSFIIKYQYANEHLLTFIKDEFFKKPHSNAKDFCQDLHRATIKNSKETVYELYRKTVEVYLRDFNLDSIETRKKLSQICSALLELFTLLRNRGIAIRDLKEGNIFISENFFDKGILDLLDFETAIIYSNPHGDRRIPQPRLGGTPTRATPSLWFTNDILSQYYGDLDRSLYLPDLYAIVEIIYFAILREPLFRKGKEVLIDIFRVLEGELDMEYFRMKTATTGVHQDDTTCVLESTLLSDKTRTTEEPEDDMLEMYKIINPLYWEKVMGEFQTQLKQHKYILKNITIKIPPEFTAILKEEIQANFELIVAQIAQYPKSSEKLVAELSRQQDLLKMPLEEMTAYKLLQLLFLTVALYMNRVA